MLLICVKVFKMKSYGMEFKSKKIVLRVYDNYVLKNTFQLKLGSYRNQFLLKGVFEQTLKVLYFVGFNLNEIWDRKKEGNKFFPGWQVCSAYAYFFNRLQTGYAYKRYAFKKNMYMPLKLWGLLCTPAVVHTSYFDCVIKATAWKVKVANMFAMLIKWGKIQKKN